MPLITKETAAIFQSRSVVARKFNQAKPEPKPQLAEIPTHDSGHDRTIRQLDIIDRMLDDCPDPKTFIGLTAAKERLWRLVYPTAGVLRPRQSKSRSMPASMEAPQEPDVITAKIEQKPNDSAPVNASDNQGDGI